MRESSVLGNRGQKEHGEKTEKKAQQVLKKSTVTSLVTGEHHVFVLASAGHLAHCRSPTKTLIISHVHYCLTLL